MKAIKDHPKALTAPKPLILFEDFGDNALLFEALFWAEVRSPLAWRQLASDIRFSVDDLFAEAGISIAFPQRDVHLDSLKPLRVELSRSPKSTSVTRDS